MAEWIEVAKESDLNEGVPLVVKVGKREVFLIRVERSLYAYGHKCPHYEAPLTDGSISGHSLICPWHNARFDLTTGRMTVPPALDDLPAYPVKVEGGVVFAGEPEKRPVTPLPGTEKQTFVVVGAGAAGNAAVQTLRAEGFAGRVIMIGGEDDIPYDRPNLSKGFLSGEAKPEWLPLRSEKYYENRQIEMRKGTRVTAVEPEKHTVVLQDGTLLEYDQLLLATGGRPRKIPISGLEQENCFYLRSFADARAINDAAASSQYAVIIGAGFIGMEVASSLRQRDLEVHIVDIQSTPMEHVFGERIGRRFRKLAEEKGVVFHLGVTVKEIKGGGAGGVVLSDGANVKADLIVVGTGAIPVVDYLKGTDLSENGMVPVDGQLRTRHREIFAAGDIAGYPNPLTGDRQRIEHWVVAESQGIHAARSMLGKAGDYDLVPFFWTRQFGRSFKYVGFARESDQIAFRGDVEEGDFSAGYYERGRLKAAAALDRGEELVHLMAVLEEGRHIPFEEFETVGLK